MTDAPTFIAWSGPSPVTGDPVMLVVSTRSRNEKTGPMWQAWLLLRDMAPFDAIRSGQDAAVCGACALRGGPGGAGRACYVNLFTGPRGIWRAARDGAYPTVTPGRAAELLAGQFLRVTAYGDPAFLPFEFWRTLLARAAGWVGYTHQWRTCDQRFRSMLMASVDSLWDRGVAAASGWRTFRVRRAGGDVLAAREFVCPASDEGGHRSTCLRCRLCAGTSSRAKSVVIVQHGRKPGVGRGGLHLPLYRRLVAGEQVVLTLTGRERLRFNLSARAWLRRNAPGQTLASKALHPSGPLRFWLRLRRVTRRADK